MMGKGYSSDTAGDGPVVAMSYYYDTWSMMSMSEMEAIGVDISEMEPATEFEILGLFVDVVKMSDDEDDNEEHEIETRVFEPDWVNLDA